MPANVSGTVSPEEHNHDDRVGDSPFTSWTHSRAVAEFHRDKSGAGDVLLRVPEGAPTANDSWEWVWSPDDMFEEEILLRGVRMNVEVLA